MRLAHEAQVMPVIGSSTRSIVVVLRDGDLAYLHVHPAGEPGDGQTQPGPDITFFTSAPSAGTYRMFLDFEHGDVVRTAAFTVTAGAHEEAGS